MDINRSLNDSTYDKKLPIYFSQNLLAQSLHEDCYKNNPNFKRFYENKNLQFEPCPVFDKQSLLKRQELYEEVAKIIWSVDRLDDIL